MAFGLPSGDNWTPQQYNKKDMIFFFPVDGMSQVLSLTATTDINYSAPVQVTQSPVMSGQTLADHIQKQPRTMQINGVVTVQYESAFGLLQKAEIGSVEDFVATVERFRDQKRLLRVISSQGINLETAFITGFEAKRDAGISNGLRVNLQFQEVVFIEQLQKVEMDDTGNGSTSSAGTKKTKDKAVVSKKDVGTSTGEFTNNQHVCDDLQKVANQTGYSSLKADQQRSLSNCLADINHVKGEPGRVYSDIKTRASQNTMYQKLGGNPGKANIK